MARARAQRLRVIAGARCARRFQGQEKSTLELGSDKWGRHM
eukprot:CAMPEP_0170207264 /NCGR_PEP_ID=MMETSP0116_2-20130129/3210_1 /TAXON_ID=400756 /ORGANISM="Durinskia baltica, Strain CSIRO CS-38" /LENGTH=40 /DNA_ID= /DNA_START= /DNA_END= /DNA_ORIENTATION=